jgi:hypothetical protein
MKEDTLLSVFQFLLVLHSTIRVRAMRTIRNSLTPFPFNCVNGIPCPRVLIMYAWNLPALLYTICHSSHSMASDIPSWNGVFMLHKNQSAKLTKLTSWSWALLEEPPIVRPLKSFPAFYGTRKFRTVFTKSLHWSLSWAGSIQSITIPFYLPKIHFNSIHPPTSWSS